MPTPTPVDDKPTTSTWLIAFAALFFVNIGAPALVAAATAVLP